MANKAFVKNIFDCAAAVPANHINAHAWALATPATASDSMQFFSICEVLFGGACLKDNHKDADHCYFILSGRGYGLVEGKRFEFGPNDLFWVPGNKDHEMYPIGIDALRFVVTLSPAYSASEPKFKATEAFVRNANDVTPVCPPKHENTSSWPLVTPKIGGSDSIEFFITEIRPGGGALKDVHEKEDHVYYFLSGKGYSIIEGERLEFKAGDALFIPRNSQHEMYPIGEETMRFVVTFAPARVALYSK